METSSPIDKEGIAQIREIICVMGELFKPSYGPKGMDKLLFDHFNNHMIITNDGGTILEDIGDLLKPEFSKYIIKWGQILKKEQNDGVKSFYILLANFFKIAEDLQNQCIPTPLLLQAIEIIKNEWRIFLKNHSYIIKMSSNQIDEDREAFLVDYIHSIIQGKLSLKNTEHISRISVEIIKKLGKNMEDSWFNLNNHLQIVKVPGSSVPNTHLYPGIFLGKSPNNLTILPDVGLNNPRILFIKQKLYIDLPDGGDLGPNGPEFDIRLSPDQELDAMKKFLGNYAQCTFEKLQSVNPNVIITEKGTSRDLESLLTKNKIILVRRAKPEEFTLIARYLDAKIVENIEEISEKNIVTAEKIQWKKIGKDRKLIIDLNPSQLKDKGLGTLIIGGSVWYACETVETLIRKNIAILQKLMENGKFFLGGGNTEIRFIRFVREKLYSKNGIQVTQEKVRYIVEKLIEGFYVIPETLAISCGMDPIQTITELTSKIENSDGDHSRYGINVLTSKVQQMQYAKVFDNFSARKNLILHVLTILQQIIRIDKVISIRHKTIKRE